MTTQQKRRLFPRSARFGLLIAILAATITGVVSGLHTRTEHRQGLEDLARRAELLAHRSAPAAAQALQSAPTTPQEAVGDRLDGYGRFLGMAIIRPDGTIAAAGDGVADMAPTTGRSPDTCAN